jgi:hypothetical protein
MFSAGRAYQLSHFITHNPILFTSKQTILTWATNAQKLVIRFTWAATEWQSGMELIIKTVLSG